MLELGVLTRGGIAAAGIIAVHNPVCSSAGGARYCFSHWVIKHPYIVFYEGNAERHSRIAYTVGYYKCCQIRPYPAVSVAIIAVKVRVVIFCESVIDACIRHRGYCEREYCGER